MKNKRPTLIINDDNENPNNYIETLSKKQDKLNKRMRNEAEKCQLKSMLE